jgi:hypothetical protein
MQLLDGLTRKWGVRAGAPFLALLLMQGCATEKAPSPAPSPQQSAKAGQPHSPQPSVEADDDCIRGEPAAILSQGSAFVPGGKREAWESVDGDAVPTLRIRHYGCAHYVLDFTFTWPRAAPPSRADALKAASTRLASLQAKEATRPILRQLDEALRTLAADTAMELVTPGEMTTITVAFPEAHVLVVTYDVAL